MADYDECIKQKGYTTTIRLRFMPYYGRGVQNSAKQNTCES